ncbi:SNF2-related protein [Butyrivibrio sp. YAB3001]|uniref:SNF2-related protein n=1 Tax=Butyrivibrio sp. YAB3001 TaxID=1520812 RepID=UPI0008F63529|nr:SNF2-related protein [Butyrivibrio sp. YAB3001]SFC35370.1 Helicase conserved C-terminal domain-containing protein [Butyrivibrio sp. YAB3001]
MKDWNRYFTSQILDRGNNYHNNGRVKGFAQTGNSCVARVVGTHVYNVRIDGLNTGKYRFSCDCAYARDGFRCKHEAAVMFHWDHENPDSALDDLNLKSDNGNTYFNIRNILESAEISAEKLEDARELIKKNKIKIKHTDLFYMQSYYEAKGDLVIRFEGEVTDNRAYPISVRITFSKEKIMSSDCFGAHKNNHDYYGYYSSFYKNICEHQLALLLLADEYIAKYNPGDDTDLFGEKILAGYKQISSIQNIDENVEKGKVIRLEPKISVGSFENHLNLFLGFKVGIEKLYVLKSIPELMDARNKYGSLKLGKSSSISFMDFDLDADAEKIYDLIEDAKVEADYLMERFKTMVSYGFEKAGLKDKIQLSPELLDKFYDIAYGKTYEITGYSRAGEKVLSKLSIGDGKAKCQVNIENITDANERFTGISVNATLPQMFKGKDYNYIIDEEKGVLFRINELSPIMKLLMKNAHNSKASFNIGKKNISEFYYRILPQMMEAPEIEVIEENPQKLHEALPPECNITYYLDVDEDNILGSVSASYDDKEIKLHRLCDSDYPLPDDRDIIFEQKAIKVLMEHLPSTDDGESFFCEKTGENTFDFLSDGIRNLMAIGEIKASKDFEKLKIRKTPTVRLGVSVESGILNLNVSTDDMSEDELLELLESYRKKKKFFRLGNGEFIKLDQDDTLEELVATMQAMGISAKEFTNGKLHLPLYRAIYINKLLEEHDEIASDRDKNFKNLVRNFNAVKDADIDVPESLTKVLRGYQEYGFKWLSTLSELGFGGILADDMGLGKTLQVITLLLSKKEIAKKDKKKISSLIVCPASLVYNWEEEFKRFAPDLKVATVTGTQAERKKLLSGKTMPEVLVTSYDLLKRDIGLYENLEFDYEIIDEAQYIKNASAAASKSVKVIKSVHRFALTGTPIENRLSELWSIFDYLMPGFLYTYDRFKSDFETSITKYKDEEITKQLKNMVGPFILRRLKENVLKDLPDKMEEVRFSKFDSAQRKLYDAQVTHMKRILESEEYKSGKDRLKVLAELTKIRQICCDPELITAGYKGESAKRQSCIELVQSAIDGGHKILLFSQFTSMLELLEKDLKMAGIEYYKITGQTSKEERIKLVHAFNENDIPLFLISLKAGGTGLNLVGADVVIHYDPWWNLAAQNQATDRAHRIGQTKKVSVFKLIAKDTIEEKIIEMQNAKKDLADAILNGESESLMNMSKDQLMELLG